MNSYQNKFEPFFDLWCDNMQFEACHMFPHIFLGYMNPPSVLNQCSPRLSYLQHDTVDEKCSVRGIINVFVSLRYFLS